MLKQHLEQRLQSLKTEYEAGQTMLAELEAKQANLRDTLLRISGAIQVLEECLSDAPDGVETTVEKVVEDDVENGNREPASIRAEIP